ncbi:ATP-binding protein [Methylobacterium nodulans]|uniref:Sensory/regulatory protein RpfC n=1 Tax=Methylobacterium nodulans (strain LMG 21967 / CNCM I-2342 / ORS 2060) TaxID=460265 RepID=B8IRE9_METNO|nr:ATP-binding protein [Methylobacterium nodulans]ACL58689.1 histidine kinase [Methylobacterium nodulans ORS 2060]
MRGEAPDGKKPAQPHRIRTRAIVVVGVVLGATFGLLTVLFMQLASETTSMRAFRDRLEQSVRRRGVVHSVFSLLQDAETGGRGFALTDDPEFLEPYEKAVQGLPAQLDELARLSGGATEQATIRRLQEISLAQLSILAQTIEMRREGNPSGATQLVLTRQSKEHMDQIRGIVGALLQAENRDVETYTAAVRDRTAWFEKITLGLAVGLAIVLIGAAAAAIPYALHRSKSEAELRRARQRAEAASRAKTDFLASMSHEIRTPLNGIIGYTDVLLDQDLKPEQRRLLERIQFAGAALLTVVNDILDFSKIEAGQVALEPRPFSLVALVSNTVSIIAEAAQRKGLALTVDVDPHMPAAVIGDEDRLRQVLLNLLNNALKFTHEGSITLQVRCEDSLSDCQWICFSVTDTGIGIPKDQHEHLFHRFYQVQHSSTREIGGTGLGLAISKRLISLMGGEIGLESEEGKGSRFWFKVLLPRTDEDVAASVLAETSEKASRSGRILLVEDLEHNRDLARMLLVNAGHQVDTAETGAEAVAAVQAKAYDLVLMDVQMPVMDGVTATKRIRELDHPARDVPIIAMTANVLPQQVKSFGDAGMNDHVGKPFKKPELLKKVNTWLQRPNSPASAPEAADAQALGELQELMGPDWVTSGLKKLRVQIEEAFGDEEAALGDRAELARRVHALVSHASLFGFAELSEFCSLLEEACTTGDDVVGPFHRAKASAQVVDRQVRDMLAPRETGSV